MREKQKTWAQQQSLKSDFLKIAISLIVSIKWNWAILQNRIREFANQENEQSW
jgi:hypothetical protein